MRPLIPPDNIYIRYANVFEGRNSALKSTSHEELNVEEESLSEGEAQMMEDPKFLARTKRWIVLVDDEESIRLAVGDYLYDHGYQVTACADADSMLEVCATPDSEDGERPVLPDAIIRYVPSEPTNGGFDLIAFSFMTLLVPCRFVIHQ